ncbi:hypothetical protein IWQ62_002495 [Dispira parvispora]|uniref:BOD1/SHG1 domain-containing protein n=1 Tax=Dispira parvispora TaxID=1520584 RepID=A0A9W8ASN2_9FUNG|nr:hypothetical protein IWQ62_002495 [Dispira parvispora]
MTEPPSSEAIVRRIKQCGAFDSLRERLLQLFKESTAGSQFQQDIEHAVDDIIGSQSTTFPYTQHRVLNKVRERLFHDVAKTHLEGLVRTRLLSSPAYQQTLEAEVGRSFDYLEAQSTSPAEPDLNSISTNNLQTVNREQLSTSSTKEKMDRTQPKTMNPDELIRSLLSSAKANPRSSSSSVLGGNLSGRLGTAVAVFLSPRDSQTTYPDLRHDRCFLTTITNVHKEEPRFTVKSPPSRYLPHSTETQPRHWHVHSKRVVTLTTRETFAVGNVVYSLRPKDAQPDHFTTTFHRAKVVEVEDKHVKVMFSSERSCIVPFGKLFKMTRVAHLKPRLHSNTSSDPSASSDKPLSPTVKSEPADTAAANMLVTDPPNVARSKTDTLLTSGEGPGEPCHSMLSNSMEPCSTPANPDVHPVEHAISPTMMADFKGTGSSPTTPLVSELEVDGEDDVSSLSSLSSDMFDE